MRTPALLLLALSSALNQSIAADYLTYFGTYTGPKSKGIYVSRFESGTGKLSAPELAAEIAQPSWVTIHPNGRFLYAVSELEKDSAITGFSIDRKTGKLTILNKVPSAGTVACHLAINKAGTLIYVANYGNGSVAGFRLAKDGTLGERVALIQHEGSGANPRRQKGPHAHAVVLSADNKFLFVPDLGTDQYFSYRAGADGSLSPADPPFAKVKGGSGPRHFAFAPHEKFAFGLNEMGSSVTAFTYNGKGGLHEVATFSTLPAGFHGQNDSAEIQVDASGNNVYASNRGHDSIAVFGIDPASGKLTELQRVPTHGKTPRSFSLDPTGKFLLAANQDSDSVVIFSRDPKSGKLTPSGQTLSVPSPVCIQFLRAD
jgi:6-phosphogluconolactonase